MEEEGRPFLSLAEDFQVKHITIIPTGLCVHVVSMQPISHCPLCGQASRLIHSRYRRVLADVPCAGQCVSLRLEVRKFFCRLPTCPRKIFTERLPTLVQSSARMTKRLQVMLQTVGLATGGEAGARLACKLGMQVTPSTLLRCCKSRLWLIRIFVETDVLVTLLLMHFMRF